MAWSQQDIDSVKAAIVDLATGKRVVTVSFAGPPARSVQYSDVEIDKLQSLLAQMESTSGNGTPYRLATMSKGL